MVSSSFIGGRKTAQPPDPQVQAQPTPQQIQAASSPLLNQPRQYPTPQPTRDERYLDFLLNPCIPKERKHLSKYWPLVSDAAKHLQLTKITDPGLFHSLNRQIQDLFVVGSWDADEYFDMRCIKLFSKIQLLKSTTYAVGMREREALVACTVSNIVRDDRTPPPKESHGFLGGMFSR